MIIFIVRPSLLIHR